MRMLCYKCNHPWNYKGILTEGKVYVTCPNCMRKVRVDRIIIEDSSVQKLLTSLPRKYVKTTSFPLILPTTTSFERVSFSDGFVYLVNKRIAKQFKESPEELEEDVEVIYEQEPPIKILSPTLPTSIQKSFYEKEQEQNNPFLNPPREEPNFEITIIPRDPIKLLEHQMAYGKWI